jgi:hypothetical protein
MLHRMTNILANGNHSVTGPNHSVSHMGPRKSIELRRKKQERDTATSSNKRTRELQMEKIMYENTAMLKRL